MLDVEEKKMPAASCGRVEEKEGRGRIVSMRGDAAAMRAAGIDRSTRAEPPGTFADTSGIRAMSALCAVSWWGNLHGDVVQVELCVVRRGSQCHVDYHSYQEMHHVPLFPFRSRCF